MDCSTSFGNQGCDGGLPDLAFEYVIANYIENNYDYPYTAVDGKCTAKAKKAAFHISSYVDVEPGNC